MKQKYSISIVESAGATRERLSLCRPGTQSPAMDMVYNAQAGAKIIDLKGDCALRFWLAKSPEL